MIRILVADDHAILRQGLVRILDEQHDFEVVAETATGQGALDRLRAGGVDVAVLDISMPSMTGLEALERIRNEGLGVAVVILSMHEEEKFAIRAMKSGAKGYLTKDRAPEELVAAIRKVAGGDRFITNSLAEKLADSLVEGRPESRHEALSERELQVMMRLARGLKQEAIAKELFLSPKTVTTYRSRILAKMGFESNADMTRYALEEGLIE